MTNPFLTKNMAEPNRHVWATVTAISPLRIKFDGETTELPFAPDTLAGNLAVNDRVFVELLTNSDPNTYGRRVVILGKSAPVDPLLARVIALEAADAASDANLGLGQKMAVSGAPGVSSGNALTTAAAESGLYTGWTSGTNSMVWKDQHLYRVDAIASAANNLAGASTAYNFTRFAVIVRSYHPAVPTGNLTQLGGTTKTSVQIQHLDEDYQFTFYVKVTSGDITSGLGISIIKDFSSESATMTLDGASLLVTDVGGIALPGNVLAAVMA